MGEREAVEQGRGEEEGMMGRWIAVIGIFFGLCLGEAQGQEVWERPRPKDGGSLEGESGNAGEALRWLEEEARREATRLWIRGREEDRDLRESRATLEAIREEGRNLYFFEGAEAARAFLLPQVEYHLEVSRAWMADAAASQAAFEASLYLLRALLDRGEEEEGIAWAREVRLLFPGHRADEQAFPPAVLEILERGAEGVREEGVAFDGERAEGECALQVNGASPGEGGFVLRKGRIYLLALNCGDERAVYDLSVLGAPGGVFWGGGAEFSRR